MKKYTMPRYTPRAQSIHMNRSPYTARAFRRHVWRHYEAHGRALPWRGLEKLPEHRRAYRVLISEIMLQQTHVERVVPKYHSFLVHFPSLRSLARAPLRDVLALWQGLGYNRRAKMLHELTRIVVEKHGGRLPHSRRVLEALPGVGSYTAGAMRVFAHGKIEVLIETNIRSVYIHHFFPNAHAVPDHELAPLIERTLDRKDPSAWYHALMDYGAALKRGVGNASRRSAHYTKQSAFNGSNRQIRGELIKLLLERDKISSRSASRTLRRDVARVSEQLEQLAREGMLTREKQTFMLTG